MSFRRLCEAFEAIGSTTRKLGKIQILSDYLTTIDDHELPLVCRFLSGYIFPRWSDAHVYVGYSTIVTLILNISGAEESEFKSVYLGSGDLGEVAARLFVKKTLVTLFSRRLNIIDIYSTLEDIASCKGGGAVAERRDRLRGLLIDCDPLEAKYLIKILTGELRIGLVEGLVMEAVAAAFDSNLDDVRSAYLVTGDTGVAALLARRKALHDATVEPMHPTSFMLADTMNNANEIMNYYRRQVFVEYKYDGVRVQAHKNDQIMKLFSRKLEDISRSFPDLLDALKALPHNFILDGEIITYKCDRPGSFQMLQHRLKRKEPDRQLLTEIPISYFVFDVLYFDGRPFLDERLEDRRRLLESLPLDGIVKESHIWRIDAKSKIQSLFEKSKSLGYEGLVVKDPNSPYKPGRRGRYWVKLKKELDTLDVVVVAAEFGHGKRAGVLSNYTFAVKDDGELKVLGKAYSGLTDIDIKEMTNLLKRLTIKDFGFRRIVKPEIVLEISFDGIQKSGRHNSGYALRFPRIKGIRYDKGPDDIDSLERVKLIKDGQRSKFE